MPFGDRLRRLCKFQKEAGAMCRVDRDLVAIRLVVGRSKPLGARRLPPGGATGRRDRRMEAPSARSQSRQPGTGPQRQRHRNPSACRPRLPGLLKSISPIWEGPKPDGLVRTLTKELFQHADVTLKSSTVRFVCSLHKIFHSSESSLPSDRVYRLNVSTFLYLD